MNEQRKALGFLEKPSKLETDWDEMLNRLHFLIKTTNNPRVFYEILLSVEKQKPNKKVLRAACARIDAECTKVNTANITRQRAR